MGDNVLLAAIDNVGGKLSERSGRPNFNVMFACPSQTFSVQIVQAVIQCYRKDLKNALNASYGVNERMLTAQSFVFVVRNNKTKDRALLMAEFVAGKFVNKRFLPTLIRGALPEHGLWKL